VLESYSHPAAEEVSSGGSATIVPASEYVAAFRGRLGRTAISPPWRHRTLELQLGGRQNSAADHAATSSAAHRTVGEMAREFTGHSVRSGAHSDEGGGAGLRRGLNLFGERRELRAGRHAGLTCGIRPPRSHGLALCAGEGALASPALLAWAAVKDGAAGNRRSVVGGQTNYGRRQVQRPLAEWLNPTADERFVGSTIRGRVVAFSGDL
jgi:hypothetical protein